MTRPADFYIAPCNPEVRNRLLDANARNGWRARPGMMDWDHGWTFDPEHATAPLIKPPPLTLRPTRPSGWTPPLVLIGLVGVGAAVLGAVAR